MDWTLCLLCTLISMTSTRCYQHAPAYPQYDQIETNHDRLDQTLWSKRDSRSTQISERDGQTQISENYDQALSDQDDQAIQRMSERSLPLDGGRQRLQDVQRRFNQENEGPRIVNVNKDSGFHLTPRRGVLPEPASSPDVVVFPGPSRRAAQFVPKVPEECLRTGICEDVPDYPEERVAAIIKQLGNATDKYNLDELDTPEVAQRIGSPDEMELCDFTLKIAAPLAARDKDGNWFYIVNRKDNPVQGFHVELCKNAGNRCANVAYFHVGNKGKCEQKFMLRFMKALDANGQLVEKQFKMPSCCSCIISTDLDTLELRR